MDQPRQVLLRRHGLTPAQYQAGLDGVDGNLVPLHGGLRGLQGTGGGVLALNKGPGPLTLLGRGLQCRLGRGPFRHQHNQRRRVQDPPIGLHLGLHLGR